MKWSRSRSAYAISAAAAAVLCVCAHADLAPWMQYVVAGSGIETALYRAMDMPGLRALYPRPPAEAREELSKLLGSKPDAQLYALRAHIDEQSLNFTAAEQDWKEYVAHASNKAAANFELADYYHRRIEGAPEVAALEAAAGSPASDNEKFVAADRQQEWSAFQRALQVAHDQALGDDAILAIDRAWIARYPAEPATRANYISTLLSMRRFDEAQKAIAEYRSTFPKDDVFPIKATAFAALQQDTPDATRRAIDLFDKNYQPLWSQDLIDSYFQLLNTMHAQHTMLASAQEQLRQHPDDLNAATRLFYYYRQEGRMNAATNVFAAYRAGKEARHAAWTPDELYTVATLLDRSSQPNDAAHYYFALAGTQGKLSATAKSPDEAGLSGVITILLASPNDNLDLGSGNLALYRDLATIDNGPGYLNGILSLWLNSETPEAEMAKEEQKAAPYFHRQKAAELLSVLDRRYPSAEDRPALHVALLHAYLRYGQDAAVIQEGQNFLKSFPQAPQRLEVALEVADADARTNNTKGELAIYDTMLAELGAKLQGMPLTAAGQPAQAAAAPSTPPPNPDADGNPSTTSDDATDNTTEDPGAQTSGAASTKAAKDVLKQAFVMSSNAPETQAIAGQYRQVLERYLGRLTQTDQAPAALAVLRHELDRNPNDPLLYERLADFLAQNDLSAQEEEVYQKAIARFHTMSFYDRLARMYLRNKRAEDHERLTRRVVDIFSGTELESYFEQATGPWPQEALQIELYAHQRFPHELTFTRRLLADYQAKPTANRAAWQKLIREHWMDAPDLQAEFFDDLARNKKLDAEMTALNALAPSAAQQQQNPAATREMAEIDLWRSHFEESAPLLDGLAKSYPTDEEIATNAASVFRSLAYNDPSRVERAAEIARNLYESDPANLDRLATIGDIYADSTSTSLNLDTQKQLAQASPYWKRMTTVHPGIADGYLQSATVFWDYFQFDDALAQIAAARKQFKDPALYGYQAGAIYEGKRDDAHAVGEYVAAAASGSGDSEAQARLLALATRKRTEALVDKDTADAVAQHPTITALGLRAAVLTARRESGSLAPLIDAAMQHATTLDEAAALATFSQSHGLKKQYESALTREISFSTDPVEHISLNYQLMRAYQDDNNPAAAQKIVETVYKENPRISSVVRQTVDFYWNNQQQKRAITTLEEASRSSNAEFAHDFILEAVNKSSASGDSAGARALLKPLLAGDPFNAQYLALEADSYAQAHDAVGLRDFYAATIDALKNSSLAPLDKRDKTATARQGMIQALTQLKDYAGATDQHIALISAFPEDDNILQNAGAYARLYSREQQLVGFLQKTVKDSPQDSRFAIDLARIDVQFEDYDGALAAYTHAIAIRKDRADLYIARADIEEHQQNYDAACADYDRLYTLTYKDPSWMEKAALARARQGRSELAVKALRAAWLDGNPDSADREFRMADQLAQWDMLAEAEPFAQQGARLAGDDLLRLGKYQGEVEIYARVLGRQRKFAEAVSYLNHLRSLGGGSANAPGLVVQQAEEQGLAAVTDKQWRQHLVQVRALVAESRYRTGLFQLSQVAATYYTPQEKLQYAKLLDQQRSGQNGYEMTSVWIPAAHAAGLFDREIAWRRELLMAGGSLGAQQLDALNTIQTRRMDSGALASTLDAYAALQKGKDRIRPLQMAAVAWQDAGNRAQELRDIRILMTTTAAPNEEQTYFSLLLERNVPQLIQEAGNKTDGTAAAEYLAEHGSREQLMQALAVHARTQSALWNEATSALFGLYYADTSATTTAHFENALANRSIGERLQSHPDKSSQLSGQPWFYYGMRYGVFLSLPGKDSPEAEDYLPSILEAHSADTNDYMALALAYSDAGKLDAAMAELLWKQGKRDAALAEWNHALAKLRATVDVTAVPESFWSDFAHVAEDVRANALGKELKPAMDTVLQAYIHKNGNYRTLELLHDACYSLSRQNANEAGDWMLALITNAPGVEDQTALLRGLGGAGWLPPAKRETVYRRELTLEQARADSNPSTIPTINGESPNGEDVNAIDENEYGYPSNRDDAVFLSGLTSLRAEFANWLLSQGRVTEAQQIFDSIPASQRRNTMIEWLEIRLAAKQAQIPALLARFEALPAAAPSLQTIAALAESLRVEQDAKDSRLLLEYVFSQKLKHQELKDTDYASLAEARLDDNDVPGAMDLLHRMTLQGDFYENLDTATNLLLHTGHATEAIPMLTRLANGVPWNHEYRVRLARAESSLHQTDTARPELEHLAGSDHVEYETRAEAAEGLHAAGGSHTFSSDELTQLASGTAAPSPDQPYAVHTRLAAATTLPGSQRVPLLRAALLTAPEELCDWLRLQIYYASVQEGNRQRADVAIMPVLARNAWIRTPAAARPSAPWNADDDTLTGPATPDNGAYMANGLTPEYGEQNEANNSTPYSYPGNTAPPKVSPYAAPEPYSIHATFPDDATKLKLILEVASLEEHQGALVSAQSDFEAASLLAASPAEAATYKTHAKALADQLALAAANDARRPRVQDSIEQSVLVRPRLTSLKEVRP